MAKPSSRYLLSRMIVLFLVFMSIPCAPFFPARTAHAIQTGQPVMPAILHLHPLLSAAINAKTGVSLPCLANIAPPLCYSPQQIRRAYDIEPLVSGGVRGQGRSIVIIDDYQDPTLLADLALFDKLFGLNEPQLNIVAPFGLHPFDPRSSAAIGFSLEIALDVQWAHAIAPDATINLVLGNPAGDTVRQQIDGIISGTEYAVANNLGDVISLSVGLGETCYTAEEMQRWHQAFRLAREKHISVLASSGDSGSAAAICNGTGEPVTEGQGVNYPASDPLVSGVGGTTLLASQKGEYLGEMVWNRSTSDAGATGGGFSVLFPRPAFQDEVPGIKMMRGVPDIAYNGDPFTGFPVVTSSFFPGMTIILPVGGTSAGAPQWAAVIALCNQIAGRRLGFLNSALYHISKDGLSAKAFHDITIGNNAFTFHNEKGAVQTIPGFDAEHGWDPTTGLGTPKTARLSTILALAENTVDDGVDAS
ncbi:MAG TPA: S53 family peptidase [Ktedonobacteraceae bacterium]|nr:S53 family peptidase [Ktedonobacteraceae bacterium]